MASAIRRLDYTVSYYFDFVPYLASPRRLRRVRKMFGLAWNSTLQYYILKSTQRSKLMTQNPSVTFSLSNSTDPTGEQKNFALPYVRRSY